MASLFCIDEFPWIYTIWFIPFLPLLIALFIYLFLQGVVLTHNASARVIRSNQSLVLQRVTRHSAGNYSCSAINAEGETVSNQLELRVKCKYRRSQCFLPFTTGYVYVFLILLNIYLLSAHLLLSVLRIKLYVLRLFCLIKLH